MAYKRKSVRFTRKRTYRKKGTAQVALKKASRALRMITRAKPELKYTDLDGVNPITVPDGFAFQFTKGIPRGVGAHERVGNDIRAQYLNGRVLGVCEPNINSSNYWRLVIVQMKQSPSATPPLISNVLDPNPNIPYTLTRYNYQSKDNFRVLYDRTRRTTGVSGTIMFKFNLKLRGFKVGWYDNATSEAYPIQNGIYAFIVSDVTTVSNPQCIIDARFYYTDS